MIDCVECNSYATLILDRGEIKPSEFEKLALDRHILKGCDKIPCFDIDQMNLNQLKDTLKMIVRLMNYESDRICTLQDRVLELERIHNAT